MENICGNCKYNKCDYGYASFSYNNEESEYYGLETEYEDSCEDFEERE